MPKSFLEQIGERIQLLRKSRGCDRAKLAEMSDLSYMEMYHIEKGRMKVSYSLYERICGVLGFTTQDLFDCFHWTYTPPVEESEENAA